jgi:hypothetical protein
VKQIIRAYDKEQEQEEKLELENRERFRNLPKNGQNS